MSQDDQTTRPAIETRGLTKTYDGKVEALRGVDLSVARGEMFALLGPNGAGKTTLFSILSTLRKPSAGEAHVLGLDVLRERGAIRRRMGIVFQEPALETHLSGGLTLLKPGTKQLGDCVTFLAALFAALPAPKNSPGCTSCAAVRGFAANPCAAGRTRLCFPAQASAACRGLARYALKAMLKTGSILLL